MFQFLTNVKLLRIAPSLGRIVVVLFLLLTAMGLSACGKKPSQIDAPEGVHTIFPHPYPDPSTDPTP